MVESIDRPTVSIVTPSYKQGKYIEKTILSVICQDYPHLEYIVVDAVSPDETQDILAKYQPYIHTLIIEPDQGQTNAINKGFSRSTGEIMAYLNSDDCYASEDIISKVVMLFEAHPQVDVIYGQRNSINAQGYYVNCMPYRPFSQEALYLSDYIPQECTFWRRQIFAAAGNYVDETFQFAMDYELWLRFLEQDAKFLSIEAYFGLFRVYEQQKSIDLWQSVGLPEIARLHQKYLHRTLPEKEMIDYYHQHTLGAHPHTQAKAFKLAQKIWGSYTTYKRELLRRTPLDAWSLAVFQEKFGSK